MTTYVKDFLEEKVLWPLEDMWHTVVDFFRGFKRLFYFFPIIWKDRDWDFDFLLVLIEHKLLSMAEYFAHGEITTRETYNEILEGIDEVLYHIRRYRESSEYYDIECGGCPIDITHTTVPSDKEGLLQLVTINAETGKPLTAKEEKIYNKYIKGAFAFERKEWKKIWEALSRNGERWWD